MNTSAMQKIFTFRRNALAISGNVSANSSRLKKLFLTSGHPGAWVIATASSVKTTTVEMSAIATLRASPRRRSRAIRDRRSGFSALLQGRHADDL